MKFWRFNLTLTMTRIGSTESHTMCWEDVNFHTLLLHTKNWAEQINNLPRGTSESVEGSGPTVR